MFESGGPPARATYLPRNPNIREKVRRIISISNNGAACLTLYQSNAYFTWRCLRSRHNHKDALCRTRCAAGSLEGSVKAWSNVRTMGEE